MNYNISFVDKIIGCLIFTFSFLKLGAFASHLFTIFTVVTDQLNGAFISSHEKMYAFNIWLFLTGSIDFLLYSMLAFYAYEIMRGRNKVKKMIKVCSIIIFFYYPVLIISNYYILGKNSLFGLVPASIATLFIFFNLVYFKFISKAIEKSQTIFK